MVNVKEAGRGSETAFQSQRLWDKSRELSLERIGKEAPGLILRLRLLISRGYRHGGMRWFGATKRVNIMKSFVSLMIKELQEELVFPDLPVILEKAEWRDSMARAS